MSPEPDVRVLDDPAQAAAELLSRASGHVALTGGSTPRAAYERVAQLRHDWSGVDVWFTDERCVAPDHEHSNFGMAERALLAHVEGASVHRMRGELWYGRAYGRDLFIQRTAPALLRILGMDRYISFEGGNTGALKTFDMNELGTTTGGANTIS